MGKYRKRPVVVDAEQFLGGSHPLPFRDSGSPVCLSDTGWYIHTLEGPHTVTYGDWVIRGVKGEFYPCKPDIFEMTYEAAGNLDTAAGNAPTASGLAAVARDREYREMQPCGCGKGGCPECDPWDNTGKAGEVQP